MTKARYLPILIALSLALSACADDDTAPTAPPDGEANGEFSASVTLDDFMFDPETLTVPAGSQVSLAVSNQGENSHTWTLLGSGPSVGTLDDLDQGRVIVEVASGAGGSATGAFTAPAAGLYQVICTIEGHLELGMEGTLVVEG